MGVMYRQSAEHLRGLLADVEPSIAEPAIRPLERLLSGAGADDPILIALVGPSGVGKSQLINALAGRRLVASGPLRPTTTEVTVWGEIEDDLSGARVSGVEPPDGMILVDTPAAEHFPETVARVLDRVDAAVLVVSPDRYADAVTAELLTAIRDRGVPVRVALSIPAAGPPQTEALIADVGERLGARVDAVVGGDAGSFSVLLDQLARDRGPLADARDRAAATFCARRVSGVADALEARAEADHAALATADEAIARAVVDRDHLEAAADHEWGAAVTMIVDAVDEATDRAVEDVGAALAGDRCSDWAFRRASEGLPPVEQAPIDRWHEAITDSAVASVKRRWLHPMRTGAVRDEFWRLGIDFERRPSKRMRKALRERLPDLRIESNDALTVAIRDACAARIEGLRSGLDPSARVTPADLRIAANLLAEGAEATPEMEHDHA